MTHKFTHFKSSHVKSLVYDDANQQLTVGFKGKAHAEYRFQKVTEKQWQSLKDAKSKGKFLSSHIIGKHSEEKV